MERWCRVKMCYPMWYVSQNLPTKRGVFSFELGFLSRHTSFIACHQHSLLVRYSTLHFEWEGEGYIAGESIWWRERTYKHGEREAEEEVLPSGKKHPPKKNKKCVIRRGGLMTAALSAVKHQGERSNMFLSIYSLTGELNTSYRMSFPSSLTSFSAKRTALA